MCLTQNQRFSHSARWLAQLLIALPKISVIYQETLGTPAEGLARCFLLLLRVSRLWLWRLEWFVQPGPSPAHSVELWSWVHFTAWCRLLHLFKPSFPICMLERTLVTYSQEKLGRLKETRKVISTVPGRGRQGRLESVSLSRWVGWGVFLKG